MNIAIIGSRSFNDYQLLKTTINKLSFDINRIISGGAKGADSLGARYAKEFNIELIEFIPNWKKYGLKAGFIRNKDIIHNSDFIIAFWDGISSGTKDSITIAQKLHKPLKVIRYNSKISNSTLF